MTRRPGPQPTAAHGTASRWRRGCRCDQCRRAHLDDQATRLRESAMIQWAERGPRLCGLIAAGRPYREALGEVGVTAQAVTAHRRRDPGFAARLDVALYDGRDETLTHGSAMGWRQGCRCPECRDTHEASR